MKRPAPPAHYYSSPRNFIHLVKQIIDSVDTRRKNRRSPTRLSVRVQPLDDDFRPDGEPFCAISSDISQRGMGFISDDPMCHDFVRIMLVEQEVSVIAQIRHSTSIGTQYPLYLIGAEFLDEYLV